MISFVGGGEIQGGGVERLPKCKPKMAAIKEVAQLCHVSNRVSALDCFQVSMI